MTASYLVLEKGKYVQNLTVVVQKSSLIFGQLINYSKSSVCFRSHLSPEACEDILHMLNMQQMSLNEKYVGINLFTSKNKSQCFTSTTDKMQSRLQGWQGKIINQAGRSTQIQTLLNTMDNFHINYFLMPKSTVQALNKIQRKYWWNKTTYKGTYKSWNSFCFPKRFRGLGFKNPHMFNLVILKILARRLVTEPDAPWIQVLTSRYFTYRCSL